MRRFAAALALLLLAIQTAHATLAVLIPTRDGFVVATDSRVTYMGTHCDGISKILIPAKPARTVVVVTGDPIFVKAPGAGQKDLDACQWLATAPRLLDMGPVVTGFLKQSAGTPAQISINDLAAACVQAAQTFQQAYPAALRAYAGKEIFSVIVASYDPGTSTTTLNSFVVRVGLGMNGSIEAGRVSQTTINPSSSRGVWIYGEADWVDRVVYKGPGRRFLNAETLDFLNPHTIASSPVSDVKLEQAAGIAANLVQAAIRAAAIDPPANGIGGEIRLMAVGSNPLPQQLPSAHAP